jgi:hypothetical protein
MTKVIALMSMSLDGYVADENDGVGEVFDWYFAGDVEVPISSETMDMTFRVSPPSADHLKGLMAEIGAMLTGRRTFELADGWGGQHASATLRSVAITRIRTSRGRGATRRCRRRRGRGTAGTDQRPRTP